MAANKKLGRSVLLFLVVCASPFSGAATESPIEGIEVRFSGEVVEVEGVSSIAIGTEVSGRYRFDPAAQDFNPADNALGLYEAVQDFVLSVGDAEYSTDTGTIGVLDDSMRFGTKVDAYTLTCGPPLVGPAVDGLPPFQMDMNLADTTASLFDGIALPENVDAAGFDIRAPTRGLQTGGHLLLRDSASGKIGDVAFVVKTLEVIRTGDDASVAPASRN
ncbi:MAG: hypothetical protein GVY22_02700 [Gammaproteobacteria bacterium]|jgi:hypothetical protein|nr:hypothetical protein [Gammaproteobacteria bacterium]